MTTMMPPPALSSAPCSVTGAVYSNRFRKALMGRIATLSSAAHEEIFRMLKENGTNHTRNKYGIHINLSAVDDTLIGKISAFVDYCVGKDRDLLEYNNKLEEYRRSRRFGVGFPMSNEEDGGDDAPDDRRRHDAEASSAAAAVVDDGGHDDGHETNDNNDDNNDDTMTRKEGAEGEEGSASFPDAADSASAASEAGGGVPPYRHAPPQLSPYQKAHLRRLNQELQPLRAAIQTDAETPVRRRNANTKYAMARKKYARRRGVDRRGAAAPEAGAGAGTGADRLVEEPYLIPSPSPSPN